jgi:hypothetical protein
LFGKSDDEDARLNLYKEVVDGEGDRAAVSDKSKVLLDAHAAYLNSLCSKLDLWRDADGDSSAAAAAEQQQPTAADGGSSTTKKKNDPEKLREVVRLCDTIIGSVALEKMLAWFGSKNTEFQPDHAKQRSLVAPKKSFRVHKIHRLLM